MFLTMFFKTQNIEQTMHLTMLIAHPYTYFHRFEFVFVIVSRQISEHYVGAVLSKNIPKSYSVVSLVVPRTEEQISSPISSKIIKRPSISGWEGLSYCP